MLKIEKTVTASPEQWEIIIEGMRNPMNSWEKMDSRLVQGTWPRIRRDQRKCSGNFRNIWD